MPVPVDRHIREEEDRRIEEDDWAGIAHVISLQSVDPARAFGAKLATAAFPIGLLADVTPNCLHRSRRLRFAQPNLSTLGLPA